ncbi:MAG TPA: succinate dehydrogenase, hydrophobic membrane anchor protein [Phenylobacterium sp.]|nr:succinate dehydrogenase, hydrophobic membrane anchor protein [Phenylobacterium sp.]
MSSLRTARSRALGLGSAHHGVSHFIVDRASGLVLIVLGLWAAWSAIRLARADFLTASDWIANPVNAVLLGLLLVATLIHVKNGVAVVIEDYIHRFTTKAALLLLNVSVCVLAGALGLFAILKAALTGAF